MPATVFDMVEAPPDGPAGPDSALGRGLSQGEPGLEP
jgi:hypothetical protein